MKKKMLLIILAVMTVIMAACGADNNKNEQTNNKENKEDTKVTIKHDLGKTEVSKNPKTIVVFDYGILDSLDKLDINVTGVAQSTNIPGYLDKFANDEYTNIGSLKEPDFEEISKLDPDVIFISSRQSDVYDELSKLGPTIYLGVDNERYMDSFKENMEVLGEIFEKEDRIKEELDSIDKSIDDLKEMAKDRNEKALIILANDDKISAYGPNSRFGIIHDVFGITAVDEGIEESTHGSNVSFEYVMEQNPDLLYVVDRSAAIGEEPAAKKIVENKLVENTTAFKEDQITYLNPQVWYLSGGGLVSVSEMIKEITASLEK